MKPFFPVNRKPRCPIRESASGQAKRPPRPQSALQEKKTMSVAPISAAPSPATAAPAPSVAPSPATAASASSAAPSPATAAPARSAAPSPATAAPTPSAARAADGDYKKANMRSSQTRDSDGDFKPLAKAASAAAQSTSRVQSSLSSLKVGG